MAEREALATCIKFVDFGSDEVEDVVIKALKKQIAKPVVVQKECYSLSKKEKRDFIMDYRCPVCNNVPMRITAKFCDNCGQKLDWSDV